MPLTAASSHRRLARPLIAGAVGLEARPPTSAGSSALALPPGDHQIVFGAPGVADLRRTVPVGERRLSAVDVQMVL